VTDLTPQLVQRALEGDARALRTLVDALTPTIQARVVRRLFRSRAPGRRDRDIRQEIEDMTQEVFVALLDDDGRALRAWSPIRGASLPSFVGLLAERQVSSILRSGRRSPWKEDPTADDVMDRYADAESDPELLAVARDLGDMLVERLTEELSLKGVQMFHLLFVQGLPAEEVAPTLKMTMQAVYAWRSRIGRLAKQIVTELREEKPRASAEANG
jgi:DNA-directed RNA polymerase specialized sigma24 family protein